MPVCRVAGGYNRVSVCARGLHLLFKMGFPRGTPGCVLPARMFCVLHHWRRDGQVVCSGHRECNNNDSPERERGLP